MLFDLQTLYISKGVLAYKILKTLVYLAIKCLGDLEHCGSYRMTNSQQISQIGILRYPLTKETQALYKYRDGTNLAWLHWAWALTSLMLLTPSQNQIHWILLVNISKILIFELFTNCFFTILVHDGSTTPLQVSIPNGSTHQYATHI